MFKRCFWTNIYTYSTILYSTILFFSWNLCICLTHMRVRARACAHTHTHTHTKFP